MRKDFQHLEGKGDNEKSSQIIGARPQAWHINRLFADFFYQAVDENNAGNTRNASGKQKKVKDHLYIKKNCVFSPPYIFFTIGLYNQNKTSKYQKKSKESLFSRYCCDEYWCWIRFSRRYEDRGGAICVEWMSCGG